MPSAGRNSGGGLSTLRKPKVQILSIGTAQPSEKITPPEIISQLTARSTDFLSAKDQRAVQVRLQAFFQSTKVGRHALHVVYSQAKLVLGVQKRCSFDTD